MFALSLDGILTLTRPRNNGTYVVLFFPKRLNQSNRSETGIIGERWVFSRAFKGHLLTGSEGGTGKNRGGCIFFSKHVGLIF